MKSIDAIITEEIKRALNEDAPYWVKGQVRQDYYDAYNALTKLEESAYQADPFLSQRIVKLQMQLREMFRAFNVN